VLPENDLFIVRGEDGEEYGPVDLEELRGWVQENRAGLGTEVRRDGESMPWQQWQFFPELVALLAEAQASGSVSTESTTSVAPMRRRALAFVLDLVLSWILALPLFYMVKGLFGIADQDLENQLVHILMNQDAPVPQAMLNYFAMNNLVSYVTVALYFAGFHAAYGRTPGKKLMHLRVVDTAGEKPGLVRAFVRALILIFSMSLLFLPLAYAFFSPQRRALHDLVAGTAVIET
jgi:uncharacterized RDD family membrane protein YckC